MHQIYAVIVGQCSDAMVQKMKADVNFTVAEKDLLQLPSRAICNTILSQGPEAANVTQTRTEGNKCGLPRVIRQQHVCVFLVWWASTFPWRTRIYCSSGLYSRLPYHNITTTETCPGTSSRARGRDDLSEEYK